MIIHQSPSDAVSHRSSQFQARADEQLEGPLPATRKEALASGSNLYRGNPCRHGHTSGRYVSTQGCAQCAKEACKGYNATRRLEAAKARTERRREIAAERAEDLERKRRNAKAQGHKRLERELAASQLEQARRATGERAPVGFTDDERAQIDAAVAAGRVTRIEQGEWDREPQKRKPRYQAPSWQRAIWGAMRHRS